MGVRVSLRTSWLVLLLLGSAVALSACSTSPSAVADKFVQAAKNGQFVEAAGYLSMDDSGGSGGQEQAAESLVKRVAPDGFKTGYQVAEQSDVTAKVTLGADTSTYMLLRKVDGKWRITEIGFVRHTTETEAIPYTTNYTDDASMWDGEERIMTSGTEGKREVAVQVQVVNGEAGQAQRTQGKVLEEARDATAKRGKKPRGTGKLAKLQSASGGACEVEVSRIERQGDKLLVTVRAKNTGRTAIKYMTYYLVDYATATDFHAAWGPSSSLGITGDRLSPGSERTDTLTFDLTVSGVSGLDKPAVDPRAPKDCSLEVGYREEEPSWSAERAAVKVVPMTYFWAGPFY